ncbi:hypothetical protein B7463_g7671, partial [Scytalidium lignicola]
MDGGKRQSIMAQRIKAEVKRSAEARREKQYIQVLSMDTNSDATVGIKQLDPKSTPSRSIEIPQTHAGSQSSNTTQPDDMPDTWDILHTIGPPINKHDVEADFIMIFLDYVFPFLFPFYRPPIFDCGRAWLLALLRDNKALFHIAMSLSSYFFTLIITNDRPGYNGACKVYTWNKLAGHMDVAIKSIQDEMQALNKQGTDAPLLDRVHALDSITQLMVFEGAMWRTPDWDVHLTAAATIFKGIFEEYGITNGLPDMEKVILTMNRPPFTLGDRHVWNTDQASFRFFAAILLYADIISSATLKRRPYLQEYHTHLIAGRNSVGDSAFQLKMEYFIGCEGWVLLTIAKITELYIWKNEAATAGTFDPAELVVQGEQISQELSTGLTELDNNSSTLSTPRLQDIIHSYYRSDSQSQVSEQTVATRIWAHAAKIYLAVVVQGWEPQSSSIHLNVTAVLQQLQAVSSPATLRSLVWPFFVAGCLAEEGQEQSFRDIASTSGALLTFGSLGEALRIMEQVWQKRNQLDKQWDLTACFNLLGTQVLLA